MDGLPGDISGEKRSRQREVFLLGKLRGSKLSGSFWAGLEDILKHCIFPGRFRVFEVERELTTEGHFQRMMDLCPSTLILTPVSLYTFSDSYMCMIALCIH